MRTLIVHESGRGPTLYGLEACGGGWRAWVLDMRTGRLHTTSEEYLTDMLDAVFGDLKWVKTRLMGAARAAAVVYPAGQAPTDVEYLDVQPDPPTPDGSPGGPTPADGDSPPPSVGPRGN